MLKVDLMETKMEPLASAMGDRTKDTEKGLKPKILGKNQPLDEEAFREIAGFETNEENKAKVKRFAIHLMSKNLKRFAVMRHMRYLGLFFKILKQPDVDMKDIPTDQFELVMLKFQREKNTWDRAMTTHQKSRILLTLKKTYKYLYGNNVAVPMNIAGVGIEKDKAAENKHRQEISDNLIDQSEVMRLIDCATTIRDQTIVALLWDTGMRVGELTNLTIRSADLKGSVAHISIGVSKTDARKVPLLFSAPYLTIYLETRKNAQLDDRLFVTEGTWKLKESGIGRGAVNKILRTLAEKAGIKKNIHAHIFRHSRGTDLAGKFTPVQMKAFFGWSGNSHMIDTYTHLSGKMIDDAFLAAHGEKIEKKEEVKSRKVCAKCEEVNPVTALFCNRCTSPLDPVALMEMDKHSKSLRDFYMEASDREKDDFIKELFTAMKKKGLKTE